MPSRRGGATPTSRDPGSLRIDVSKPRRHPRSQAAVWAFLLLVLASDAASAVYSSVLGDWAAERARHGVLAAAAAGAAVALALRGHGTGGAVGAAAWILAGAGLLLLPIIARTGARVSLLSLSGGGPSSWGDAKVATRWAVAVAAGAGGTFFLLGFGIGSALYQRPRPVSLLFLGVMALAAANLRLVPVPYAASVGPGAAASGAFALAAYRLATGSSRRGRVAKRDVGLLVMAVAAVAAAWAAFNVLQEAGCSAPQPLTAPSSGLKQLWRCSMRGGGLVAVVEGAPAAAEGAHLRYRLLRLDHSIMGGIWTHPPEFQGRPVYTAFLLQAGARLLLPPPLDAATPRRSLHVGLGVGTAVTTLQRRGFVADAVEIHPEIVEAAQKWFGLRAAGEVAVDDALRVVPRLNASSYDLVILDVFSGGSGPAALRSEAFFKDLKRTLRVGGGAGALAVNFVGFRGQGLDLLACRLKNVFEVVRGFADGAGTGPDAVGNYVVIGTDSRSGLTDLKGAVEREIEAIKEEGPEDDAEVEVLQGMASAEIDLSGLKDPRRCEEAEAAEARAWLHPLRGLPAAASHWRTMRQQFGNEFWFV